MSEIFDWLTNLPPAALYLAMAVVAAIENIFPPIPADVIVAFGAFLAARQHASPIPSFIAVFIGTLTGAAAMYSFGRKYGTAWIRARLRIKDEAKAEQRFRDWYGRYGFAALFLSRFLPGIRSLVPPLAGAMGVSPLGTLGTVALASGIWYAVITWLAFRAGSNFEALTTTIGRFGRWTAIVAAAVAGVGLLIWLIRRRRRQPT
jgi:membrane protein DedA with SNARE-associated domain